MVEVGIYQGHTARKPGHEQLTGRIELSGNSLDASVSHPGHALTFRVAPSSLLASLRMDTRMQDMLRRTSLGNPGKGVSPPGGGRDNQPLEIAPPSVAPAQLSACRGFVGCGV